eukprot:jgi/Tetstr1/424893/TSEL_015388.t1
MCRGGSPPADVSDEAEETGLQRQSAHAAERKNITMAVSMKTRGALQAVARALGPRPTPVPMKFEDSQRLEAERKKAEASAAKDAFSFGDPEWKMPLQQQLNKSFSLHLGADIRLPCKQPSQEYTPQPLAAQPAEPSSHPFDGVPLAEFAERLGGRIAPVYHEFKKMEKEAERETEQLAHETEPWELSVPHFLPFTKMATQSPEFRKTFVFDANDRKTARLSWYHPDDTMVPRDWLQGGLVADFKYYFGKQ